jgi:hypothetical protein
MLDIGVVLVLDASLTIACGTLCTVLTLKLRGVHLKHIAPNISLDASKLSNVRSVYS